MAHRESNASRVKGGSISHTQRGETHSQVHSVRVWEFGHIWPFMCTVGCYFQVIIVKKNKVWDDEAIPQWSAHKHHTNQLIYPSNIPNLWENKKQSKYSKIKVHIICHWCWYPCGSVTFSWWYNITTMVFNLTHLGWMTIRFLSFF